MLDRAKKIYRDNRGALCSHLLSTSLLMGDRVGLAENLVSLLTQLNEIPLAALDYAFGVNGREAWAIAQSDPIFIFECLGCEVTLEPMDPRGQRRLTRELRTVVQEGKEGDLVSVDLLCARCTQGRLELQNDECRLNRLSHQARLAQLARMRYEEYLEQPEWQAVRADVLARAEYRCKLCNAADEPLHVHHRVYRRRGCERPQDLTALCRTCHQLVHGIGRQDAS
jgi:5-methylcytosine-specific restriction endonuclease McrA